MSTGKNIEQTFIALKHEPAQLNLNTLRVFMKIEKLCGGIYHTVAAAAAVALNEM